MTACSFIHTRGKTCRDKTYAGSPYCYEHFLMRNYPDMMSQIIYIIAEYSGENYDDLSPQTELYALTSTDSLLMFEIAMALEETFGPEIQDDTIEEIKTINDLHKYVSERSHGIIKESTGKETKSSDEKSKLKTIEKQLNHLFETNLFNDYMNHLGMNVKKLDEIIKTTINTDPIKHITTAPKLNKDKTLKYVDIFFLTEKSVLFLKVELRKVSSALLPIKDINITTTFNYSEDQEINSINTRITFLHNDLSDLGGNSIKYTFTEEYGIKGALSFIRKYNRYRMLQE